MYCKSSLFQAGQTSGYLNLEKYLLVSVLSGFISLIPVLINQILTFLSASANESFCTQLTVVQVRTENTLNNHVNCSHDLKIMFKGSKLSDYLPLN